MAMKGIIQGTLLTVAMRWTDRLIGLVSTLVLARLLVPADFGVIAMASLVIALADVFFDLGVYVTLIQRQDPSREHFNTAWTMGLIQAAVAATVLFIAAPYAAIYFREPRVEDVIKVLGLSLLATGCENVGVVNFQKEMRFGRDFLFLFSKRFSGFVVTLVAAWILRSYWALIIGTVAGRLVGVACSYWMHPMRPRLSLSKFRDIFGMSQWLLVRTAGGYLEGQLHHFVVGRRENATVMGAFAIAGDIAVMPSSELLMPINRVLFPAFVKVKEDLEELKRVFLVAQNVQILVALPAGAGLALVAQEAISLMLGDKWLMAVPFVQILALSSLASAMLSGASYLMITLGNVRALAIYSWIQVGIFSILAFVVFPTGGALQVAWLRLAVSIVSGVIFFSMLLRVFAPLKLSDLARGLMRPAVAVSAMAASLQWLGAVWVPSSFLPSLIVKVILGAVVYATVIVALWWVTGRPKGAESFLLDNFMKIWNRRKGPQRDAA